jgi:hypothetical protein
MNRLGIDSAVVVVGVLELHDNVGVGCSLCGRDGRRHEVRLGPYADIDLRRRALVCGFGGKHVVSRQRPPDTFERELTHRLDRDGIFNRHEDARTD